MATYKRGDVVLCKVSNADIVPSEAMDFEGIFAFDIVCETSESAYLVQIPRDVFIKRSFILTEKECKNKRLQAKFAGAEVYMVLDHEIVKLKWRMQGFACARCGDVAPWASPTRFDENGDFIFICYLCRNDKYR